MNKVEALRLLKEKNHTLNIDQRALLLSGFNSPFWSLLSNHLKTTLESLCYELESCQELDRIRTVQGEIAALRVLVDWSNAVKSAKPIA